LFMGQYKPPIQHSSPNDKGAGAGNWQYTISNKWNFYGIVLRNVGILSFKWIYVLFVEFWKLPPKIPIGLGHLYVRIAGWRLSVLGCDAGSGSVKQVLHARNWGFLLLN
jgi:hypothetical protein